MERDCVQNSSKDRPFALCMEFLVIREDLTLPLWISQSIVDWAEDCCCAARFTKVPTTERSLERKSSVCVCCQDYYFSYDVLTDGLCQPKDRGCRRCGRIGHFVNKCPLLTPKGLVCKQHLNFWTSKGWNWTLCFCEAVVLAMSVLVHFAVLKQCLNKMLSIANCGSTGSILQLNI